MKPRRFPGSTVACVVVLGLGAIVSARLLLADGGVVRLRSADNAMVATLFTPSDLTLDIATDITVMVQDESSGEVLMDAVVDLQFVAPPGARMPPSDPWCRPLRSTLLAGRNSALDALVPVQATREQSDNRLLYGASVMFPVAGEWQVRLTARRGTGSVTSTCTLSVRESSNRLAAVWLWLAMPPGLIGLYVINQCLRRRPASAMPHSDAPHSAPARK